MSRLCIYCQGDLATEQAGPNTVACRHCGLRYSTDLLNQLPADWNKIVRGELDGYSVLRSAGPPPDVTIFESRP